MAASSRPPALPALTGLRFVAAFVVMLFHLWLTFDTRMPAMGVLGRALGSVVQAGYAGVTLFFVLSGFILAYTYDGERTGARAFWWARIARVVPMYLVSLVVAAPLFVGEHFEKRRMLALAAAHVLAMVQAWTPRYATAYNPPAWSLSNEAAFYLLFPALLPLLQRLAARARVVLAALLWMACLAGPIAYLALAPDGAAFTPSPLLGSWWLDGVKFWPPLHVGSFVIGVVLGMAVRRRPVSGAAWGPAATGGAIAATLALVWSGVLPYPVQHTAGLAPLATLLIAGLATGRGAFAAFCAHPFVVRLGEASYSLYLLHVPLLAYALHAGRAAGVDTRAPWFAAMFVVAALAVSWAALKWIEEPARRALRARATSRG